MNEMDLVWLLEHASDFASTITLAGVIASGGFYVARMIWAGRRQVQQVLTAVDDIKKQLQPNGGTSMFDLVKSANRTSLENAEKLSSVVEAVDRVRAYQWQFAETLSLHPIWESDQRGNCTRVNLAYAKLAGRVPAELIGSGWENFISPQDRARVSAEWTNAVEKKRAFESEFTVQNREGKKFSVKAIAAPVATPDGKVVSYLGRYEQVTPL